MAVIALAVAIVISQWVRIIQRPDGDFYLHWVFGLRFRLGAFLYAAGMHRPYPPFWALACTPLTLLPMPLMRALLYPLGLVPLAALIVMLHRRTRPFMPLPWPRLFWATTLGLALASRFLIRELPECGANLMIFALAWGGFHCWSRRRDVLGGASLGLAIALKCTPALFVLYFAWKRQWRIVAASTIAALVFTLSPMLWMGPHAFLNHARFWLGTVYQGATEPHPLRGVLGDEEPYNLSLRPALGRYLVHLPPNHVGYPWRLDVLDLDPVLAGRIIRVVMLALLGVVAVVISPRVGRRDGLVAAWEAAAVAILMLLLSPITWRQHCVAVLPACLLLSRTWISRGLPRTLIGLTLGYALLVIVLDRGVIGPALTLRLDSLGVTAAALLLLLAATLGGRCLADRAEREVLAVRFEAASRSAPSRHRLESRPRSVA